MKIKKIYILLVAVIVVYLFIVSSSLDKSIDDENVYFYMGKLIAEGNVPYKDFFLSHPPLQFFLFGLLFKIFGFKLLLFKSISVIATIISVFFIFKFCEKKYNLLTAFFSVVFFLFSHETLITSTANIGMNIAIMFVVIGFYMLFDKKYFISGLFMGLASLTSLFALIPCLIFFIYVFAKIEKGKVKFNLSKGKSYFFGFFISFILISLILMFVTKGAYFSSVFKYHLVKKPFEQSSLVKFDLIKKMIMFNPFIFAGLFLYILFHRNKIDGKNIMFYTSLIYLILLFLMLKNVFPYYFMMIFPFLAIITAISVSDKKMISIIVGILFLISAFNSVSYFTAREKVVFKNNEDNELSNLIKDNSEQDDLIFGDYLITSLVALKSDRKIALNFVDTHYLRFASGLVDVKELVNDLKNKNLKYFLITNNNILYSYKEVNNYLNESCYLRGQINLNVPTHFTKETIVYPLKVYDCKHEEDTRQ